MCSQTPAAIKAPANQKFKLVGSPNTTTANAAPTKGAVEKYAPVRAVPNPRRDRTNNTKLKP